MDNKLKPDLDRRRALKLMGLTALSATVAGCTGKSTENIMALGQTVGLKESEVPTDKMTYSTVNEDKVSILGFGCMRFPTTADGKIDEIAAEKLVDYAMAHGVTYYDTAWPYHGGASELTIGRALKKYDRKSFYLADKMPTWAISRKEQIHEIFNKQLEKCQVDYFDYYLLHNLQTLRDYKRVYEDFGGLAYLIEQKKKGKIRKLGWSFHGDMELFEYVLNQDIKWDFVQVQINYNDWNHARIPAKKLYDMLTERNIPIVVMEPLLGGRLARLNEQAIRLFHEAEPTMSNASWAFRFLGSLPNMLTVLSGMTYMEHLQDNIKTYSPLKPLTDDEFNMCLEAADLLNKYQTIPCTDCKYCVPCPYGVEIPGIFTFYNKIINHENLIRANAEQDEEWLQKRKIFLTDYNRAVPKMAQADRCIGCRECVPLCPQMIDIPRQLQRIDRLSEDLKLTIKH